MNFLNDRPPSGCGCCRCRCAKLRRPGICLQAAVMAHAWPSAAGVNARYPGTSPGLLGARVIAARWDRFPCPAMQSCLWSSSRTP